jgi:hypothetical protein
MVEERVLIAQKRLDQTVSFGQFKQDAISDLWQVYMECRVPDWDGYGALAVSDETCQMARAVIEALSRELSSSQVPSAGAEPDGQLTLEWYRSPRRLLSVSIDPMGYLHYAALIGASETYGTESFFGDAIPRTILDLIRRVMNS